MLVYALVNFVDLFVLVFNVLLIARIVASYLANPQGGFYRALAGVTEPVLAPVRQFLPPLGGLDLAPLAVFFLLQALQYGVHGLTGI